MIKWVSLRKLHDLLRKYPKADTIAGGDIEGVIKIAVRRDDVRKRGRGKWDNFSVPIKSLPGNAMIDVQDNSVMSWDWMGLSWQDVEVAEEDFFNFVTTFYTPVFPIATDAGAITFETDTPASRLSSNVTKGRAKLRPTQSARGYETKDAPLLREMKRLIGSGEVSGRWQAAQKLAPQAAGGGAEDSRAKRLLMRYSKLNNSEQNGED